jgi:hypothetical protein
MMEVDIQKVMLFDNEAGRARYQILDDRFWHEP